MVAGPSLRSEFRIEHHLFSVISDVLMSPPEERRASHSFSRIDLRNTIPESGFMLDSIPPSEIGHLAN
jgi:hypothetical protein